jgi:hypothetical protein
MMLIQMILRLKSTPLHAKMLNDWKAFNADPYWAVKKSIRKVKTSLHSPKQ